jgi:hypothetical protein
MFKFDEYPEIKKAYKEETRLKKIAYNLETKIWADGRGKEEADEAGNNWGDYQNQILAQKEWKTIPITYIRGGK